jgi:hypothetical protein
MKYSKKRARYEGSNVWFDKETMTAKSYDWWVFVARIGGLVVFNTHSYSSSTGGHQRKVRALLEQLNINIDLCIDAPQGLQKIDEAISHQNSLIQAIEAKLVKGRANKRESRLEAIEMYKHRAATLRALTEETTSWV